MPPAPPTPPANTATTLPPTPPQSKQAYVEYELQSVRLLSQTYECVYHWSTIPEWVLEDAGFIHDFNKHRLNRIQRMHDSKKPAKLATKPATKPAITNFTREYGLDAIAHDGTSFHGVQCKMWRENRRITANDLGSFISVIFNRMRPKDPQSKGILVTSAKLQRDLMDDMRNGGAIRVVHMPITAHCANLSSAAAPVPSSSSLPSSALPSTAPSRVAGDMAEASDVTDCRSSTSNGESNCFTLYAPQVEALKALVQWTEEFERARLAQEDDDDDDGFEDGFEDEDDDGTTAAASSSYAASSTTSASTMTLVPGLLCMPCGTGKTVILSHFLRNSKFNNDVPSIVILASPFRVQAAQLLDRVSVFLPNHSRIIVDSDAASTFTTSDTPDDSGIFTTTDAQRLRKHMFIYGAKSSGDDGDDGGYGSSGGAGDGDEDIRSERNAKLRRSFIISTTFDSLVNVIGPCLLDFDARSSQPLALLSPTQFFMVIDEAHNITMDVGKVAAHASSAGVQTLLMTATPSRIMQSRLDDDVRVVYAFSMGKAIEQQYVCDYRIVLPHLTVRTANEAEDDNDAVASNATEDANTITEVDMSLPHELVSSSLTVRQNPALALKCLFLANGMLQYGCVRCIVFCSRVEECVQFCQMFKNICEVYHGICDVFAHSIVASTAPAQRTELLDTFETFTSDTNRYFSILTSVRILSEGVDLVKCDSVFLTCASTDPEGIRSIQRMCRANRIDRDRPKKVAHCFVWADDADKTAAMLHSLKYAHHDEELASLAGDGDTDDTANGMRELASRVCMLRSTYDKRVPVNVNGDGAGAGTSADQTGQDDASALRAQKFIEYKIENIGCTGFVEKWRRRLQALEAFIRLHNNKKRPSKSSKDPNEKRLATWINTQQRNYARGLDIMKDPGIRKEWQSFVEAHSELFEDNVTIWRRNLRELRSFIESRSGNSSSGSSGGSGGDDDNAGGQQQTKEKRRPLKTSKDPNEKRLAKWITHQQHTYARGLQIMKDPAIRKEWQSFVEAHSELFEDNVTKWRRNFRELRSFMESRSGSSSSGSGSGGSGGGDDDAGGQQQQETKKRKPSQCSKDPDEKFLAQWINKQQINYARGLHIMKDPVIRKEWQSFVEAHSELFEDNVTIWRRNLRELRSFMESRSGNSSTGSGGSGGDDDNAGGQQQQQETKKKRPSTISKDPNEKFLANWIQNQQKNYARGLHIMKDPAIRKEWQSFVEAHSELFEDNVAKWRRNLRELRSFIESRSGNSSSGSSGGSGGGDDDPGGQQQQETKKKRPSTHSKDPNEKRLGQWISNQQRNYARGLDIMKDPGIRKEWQSFVEAHGALFRN